MMMKNTLILLVGCASLAGCTQAGVDIEAETAALQAAADAYHAAGSAKDIDAVVSHYTSDSATLPPNAASVQGLEAMREFATAFTQTPGFSMSFGETVADVGAGGDMGYTLVDTIIRFDGPDGKPVEDHVRDFHLWRKDGGEWKIAVDIWNSELPLPGADDTGEAIVSEVLALIDQRKLDEAFELYALDYIYHGPGGMELRGRDGIRGLWDVFLIGFPDLHSTIEDMVSAGDKVVLRWRIDGTHTGEFLGIAPSNRKISLGVTEIFRFADGQLVEAWDQYDRLGLMQQIGAIPMPEDTPVE
jgi:ketosteroid isomerase-like protein